MTLAIIRPIALAPRTGKKAHDSPEPAAVESALTRARVTGASIHCIKVGDPNGVRRRSRWSWVAPRTPCRARFATDAIYARIDGCNASLMA
jgi:hypothetical protein